MRNISTRTHGILEYILAISLWLTPNIFDFERLDGSAVSVPRTVAVMIIGLSLLTNFEMGIFKIIPMKLHLAIDYIVSIFLAASPFLFGFNNYDGKVGMPHVIAGLVYLVVSLLTEVVPSYEAKTREVHARH